MPNQDDSVREPRAALSRRAIVAGVAAGAGVGFVDDPVSGTREPAEKGQLLVLASAPAPLRERVTPVFDAVGSRTMWVGEEPGVATRLKLVLNDWLVECLSHMRRDGLQTVRGRPPRSGDGPAV